jgi:hypothetical protein
MPVSTHGRHVFENKSRFHFSQLAAAIPSTSPAVDASWNSVGYSVQLDPGTLTPGTFACWLRNQHLAFAVTSGALF